MLRKINIIGFKNKIKQYFIIYLILSNFIRLLKRIKKIAIILIEYALWWPIACILNLFNVRFLSVGTNMIGHLAGELDCYLKEKKLSQNNNKYIEIILAPHKEIANKRLLEYFDGHFLIIKSQILCWILKGISKNKLINIDTSEYFYHIATTGKRIRCYDIYKSYRGLDPIIKLKEEDYEKGFEWLRKKGIPRNAWFMTFHARDSSFHNERALDQSFRDSDINNYSLAFKEITERGGWCIRVGANRADKLIPIKGVIESDPVGKDNEWLDIFLCAQSRFFLGSSSGFILLPTIFGTPIVKVNGAPLSAFPHNHRDLYIPKLIYSTNERRYLSFKEIFDSEISNAANIEDFEKLKLICLENSQEDIKDVVIEMIDNINSKETSDNNDADTVNQENVRKLLRPDHIGYNYISKLGREFLIKHEYLLKLNNKCSKY
jgi:putative glycosyltransferase (TIGR04372 family)